MTGLPRAQKPAARSALLAVVVLASFGLLAPQASADVVAGGSWSFDETSGTVAHDDSGNGNDGVLHGGVVLGQPGHTGTSYSFAKAGSWVEVPSNAGLNPGTRNFTYSAWVDLTTAPTTSGVTYDIIRKGLSWTAGGEFKVEVISGGRIRCTTKDANGVRAAVTGPRRNVAEGGWHRIACIRTATAWQVMVDDTVRTKTITLGSIGNTRSLSIGSKYGQEDGTPGLVDDVSLTIG